MKNLRAHIYLFIVNLFYGMAFIISKIVMPQYIKPFGVILIRVSCTAVLFSVIHHFWIKEKVEKKDMLLLAVCGLFGVVINQELFYSGLSITTPINASLIMIMTPVFVFVISFFMAHEKATWQKILGLVLGSAGALTILGGRGFSFSGHTVLGDFFVLCNATSYAIYLVIVRPLMKKYHPLTVVKWVFLFGWGPVFLIGLKQFSDIDWAGFTWQIWFSVAFIIICVTFLAYLLNVLAMRQVHSSVVGAYIYLQPVVASIVSMALGKDHITAEKIISAVLIFSGVYFVSFAGTVKVFAKPGTEPDSDDMVME